MRLKAAMATALMLGGCVSIPTSDTFVADWAGGVTIWQRHMTPLDLSQYTARDEWWARNPTQQLYCLAMLQKGTTTPITTWTLAPGAYVPMFNDAISEYSSERYFRGRFIAWSPMSGECSSAPTVRTEAIADLSNW